MDKLAQKRSLPSKILEKVNLPGMALEKLNPEVEKVMNEMRDTDEKIREIAQELRSIVRGAKSFVRTRDYISAALQVAAFHQRTRHIAFMLDRFAKNIDFKHYKFMLEQSDDFGKEQLFGYDPQAEIKEACTHFYDLAKQGGVLDWTKEKYLDVSTYLGDIASNILTGKGHARRLMEQRFPSSLIKDMKKQTERMVLSTERMLQFLLGIFNNLESGVSRRNIHLYRRYSESFVRKFNQYHNEFLTFYNKVVVPIRNTAQQLDAEAKAAAEKAKTEEETKRKEDERQQFIDQGDQIAKLVEEQNQRRQEAEQQGLKQDQINPNLELALQKKKEKEKSQKEETKEVLDKLEKMRGEAHLEFFDKLNKYSSTNNVEEFVKTIMNYALMVDQNTANKLNNIANQITQDFNLKKKVAAKPPSSYQLEPDPFKSPKAKPPELTESLTAIDLPLGTIDQAFSEVAGLKNITPEKIVITPATGQLVSESFLNRLKDLNIDTMGISGNFSNNFISVLKNAMYNGWLIATTETADPNHPKDKYLEMYTRLPLKPLNPNWEGFAKLKFICRLSSNKNTVTLKNIQKYFTLGK